MKNVGRFNIKTTAKIGKRIEDDRLSIKSDKNVDTSSAGKKQRNHRRTASDSEVKEAPREFRTDLLMVDKKDDYENSGSVIIDLSENVSPSATTSNLELVPGIEKASEQKAIPNIHSKPRDLNDKNLFSVLAKQVVMLTSSSKEAGKLARRIFEALCYDTKQFLYRHTKTVRIAETSERPAGALIPLDFSPFFENQEESFRAFCVFDKNKNGFITRQDIKDTIVDYHKERQSLSASLRDMGSAVGKLDIVLTVLSLVLTVLSGLLIFGVSLGPYLVTSVSVIVAIAVILGNSARNMFEGMVFL